MDDRFHRRRSGLLIPLFSCPSTDSWGVGDIEDLRPVTTWLAGSGQQVLQVLPLNEMAAGQQSPYSAISAMAIDPLFIRPQSVPEFAALGGEAALGAADRAMLGDVRSSERIQHAAVRRVKAAALRMAFERFLDLEWCGQTPRAQALREFVAKQAWWIEDYGLFRAIHAAENERPWTEWSTPLQRREPAAIDAARRELAREVLYHQYLQWIADTQWQAARADAEAKGVALFGDLPFMVDGDSADVWSRQHQFHLDVSVGVPPDAFSPTGQDWGMPMYRWDVITREDFRWLRERARRAANLFHGFRVDHLVGFYRTYGRPRDGGLPFFFPDQEPEQIALGEQVLAVFGGAGAEIIAEDLGTVPDFVRGSLARLGVPGFKVFRWERHWHDEGQPFRDPAQFPAVSVATTGTHDTDTLIVWWENAPVEERLKVAELPMLQRAGIDALEAPLDVVRDKLLELLFASGSNLVLLPIQDVFGWRDRINEPATISDMNWSYRLPWPTDRFGDQPEACERQRMLRRWSEQYGRL